MHPSLVVQDVYKILFQGTMGLKHILRNKEEAFSILEEEFMKTDPKSKKVENLCERISIDGSVIRVNLRPYKRKSSDIRLLFDSMVTSEKIFIPDEGKLKKLWEIFKSLVQKGELNFNYGEVISFYRNIITQEDTAIRHSEIYRKSEKPSYRIVLSGIFSKHCPFLVFLIFTCFLFFILL
jgi:hypothetical protein